GSVLPISVRLRGEYGIEDVCLSIPVRVGIEGAGERLQIPLSDDEHRALVSSADTLKSSLCSLSL
ncbi:MAG: L-lactate dehydrogenase, partial [Chromatiaceae bacterium]|nr:L-lactate dehydrogenase [Chromatiaceae bacterium]